MVYAASLEYRSREGIDTASWCVSMMFSLPIRLSTGPAAGATRCCPSNAMQWGHVSSDGQVKASPSPAPIDFSDRLSVMGIRPVYDFFFHRRVMR